MKLRKMLNNLKKKITVLAVAMIAIQPVLAIGMMPAKTFANIAGTGVVINEVQIAGLSDVSDEFVELYNPTDAPIAMTNWRLSKETNTGTISSLVADFSGTIPAKGYFLIAPTEYTGSGTTDTEDVLYSTTGRLAVDNTVLLYSDAGITVVDKVGYGTATDFEPTVYANNPVGGNSIQRTIGADTDVNSADFTNNATPSPKNSSVDVVAPVIAAHLNETVDSTSASGAVVTYANPTATDNFDGSVPVTCIPPSGSTFPIGVTMVTCSASDIAGNPATSTTFTVTVNDKTAPGEVTDLTAVGGNSKATLKWTNPDITLPTNVDFAGVNIYRNDNPTIALNGTLITEENYTDLMAVNGTTYMYTVKTVDSAGNESVGIESESVTPKAPVVLSPVVTTVVPAVATVVVPETVAVQDDQFGGSSDQGEEVKADTTVKPDEGNKTENTDQNEETKGKKNIPLWGIIFLLVLAGIGGYLFYSQGPDKSNGKK